MEMVVQQIDRVGIHFMIASAFCCNSSVISVASVPLWFFNAAFWLC
jgi:hypothetical protein